ncbi:3-oxoacyl-ACP reductase FabG [Hydrogenovibrio kuenenii]|uniref:3-oxoacyl-ACP reductase FabG n=1 Tax=Hydrogenovibrio kuenenii TaxID=63658 RepID=UPI0004637715|nr:3-oxoacyl-ACP reductase FabG [Hydrogenovibrio kuenenii]
MLTGKIAFVTGASRGIGKAIALDLAANGATVIGTATSESGANAISEYLKEAGATGTGMCLDVTQAEMIAAVLAETTEKFGVPTILVNNAGITRDNLLMRMKDDEWDDIIQTNLSSVYRMSKACLRGMMKAKGGAIINIASVVGVMGNAGQTNYAAAKAGIIGFSKSLAREVGSKNITVNTVAPGFIDTDMTRALPQEQRDSLTQQIPLKRLGSPEDIAKSVTFLASEGGSYITGQTLNVNGGMYMI